MYLQNISINNNSSQEKNLTGKLIFSDYKKFNSKTDSFTSNDSLNINDKSKDKGKNSKYLYFGLIPASLVTCLYLVADGSAFLVYLRDKLSGRENRYTIEYLRDKLSRLKNRVIK